MRRITVAATAKRTTTRRGIQGAGGFGLSAGVSKGTGFLVDMATSPYRRRCAIEPADPSGTRGYNNEGSSGEQQNCEHPLPARRLGSLGGFLCGLGSEDLELFDLGWLGEKVS